MRRRKAAVLRIVVLLLLSLFVFCGCTGKENEPPPSPARLPAETETPEDPVDVPEPEPESEPQPEPVPDPKQEAVETLLGNMSLEEKVGQMFFVRCPDVGAVEKIRQYYLGGYLLFLRDFKDSMGGWLSADDFMRKIASYQEASPIPLLIGVDEEGGTVARASRNPNLFPKKFQAPQAVYAAGVADAGETDNFNAGMDWIRGDAVEKNAGLRGYGINVNFGPVADVSTDPNDFIYDRAFGQDAEKTAFFTAVVVGEMRHAKVGSVLKHFPGYGNNVDTHTGIAIDERPYEQFQNEDFLPFRDGIEAGADAVLVSHNIVNCMDGDFPASLSAKVHGILRDELGFNGVVLTDDLAMDAVEAYAEDGSVAVLAVLAGNDMIVTTDFEEQIPLVIDAVQVGMIDESVIDTAVSRVLGWKYDLGLIE